MSRPSAGDRAWLAACAAALLLIPALLFLAPPLGRATAPAPLHILPDPVLTQKTVFFPPLINPEPTELARFAIAVLAAIALAAWIAYGPASLPPRLRRAARIAAVAGPAAASALLVAAWISRDEPFAGVDRPDYFSAVAGLCALTFAALVVWLARRPAPAAGSVARRSVALLRRSPVAAAIAVVVTVCCLLPGVFTDASLPDALDFITVGHLPALMADFTAVGNGLTPGVDFAAQYSSLLPYLLGPILAATDYSPGAFTILCSGLSAVALLALWRALFLVTRDQLAGLALFIPVAALSTVPLTVAGDERLANNSQYQILPERYLMPCLLAWAVAAHLRGRGLRRPELIFFLAALAVINNPEFGIGALTAAFAALAVAGPADPSARSLPGLVGRAAAGGAAALIVVVMLDLIRSGSLPSPEMLTYYARLFGSQGFGMLRMPTLGLHLALYLTFAGALALGAYRARNDAADRTLAGMLVYAGLFGLIAGGYYAGRSNAYSLIGLYPAWGFCLALLSWTAWRALRDAPDLRVGLSRTGVLGLAPLVGLGLAVTTVTAIAAPWSQVARIAENSDRPDPFDFTAIEQFVGRETSDGETIAWIGENGSLIARDVGIQNVAQIGDAIHVISTEQLDDTLDLLDEAGGSTVITYDNRDTALRLHRGITAYLRTQGFAPVATDAEREVVIWRRP